MSSNVLYDGTPVVKKQIMADQHKQQEKLRHRALSVTRWVGSPQSVVLHTLVFIASFIAVYLGLLPFERMLLVLTTIVSLEAIYLSIFIQMTINYTTASLVEVGQDIEEIQEDVAEIQEDVQEMQEDVDEIQEDVEEMSEEDKEIAQQAIHEKRTLQEIHTGLQRLMQEVEELQQQK